MANIVSNQFSRRDSLKILGAGTVLSAFPATFALANTKPIPDGFSRRHGFSVFGDLTLPEGFTHLPYVNPNAPISGKMITTPVSLVYNQSSSFDTLNGLINKNEGPPMIQAYIFTTLVGGTLDEEDSVYGLLSENFDVSDDERRLRFNLRDFATFADGSKITAEDVVFSYNTLREKGHFLFARSLEKLEQISALDEHIVEMQFQEGTSRLEIIGMIGKPILSKAFYTEHDFEKADLTRPLASGSYEVGKFDPGKYIEYNRIMDSWEDQVPIAKGQANFKKFRMEIYRDSTVAFEGFKAGQYLFRSENSSQQWANAYDFPAVKQDKVKQEILPDGAPSGTQGMYFNLRRQNFKDSRVRQAIGLMFDFEWTNANLFYGQYSRTESYFQNTPYMAKGIASDLEKEILAPYLDQLPENILAEPWQAPQTRGNGRLRRQLAQASALLDEAGWKLKNGVRVNDQGERLELNHPFISPMTERYMLPFKNNLEKLGVLLTLQRVEPAQYVKRRKNFEYDLITGAFGLGLTPTKSITQFFGSEYAHQENSYNLAGIENPMIDEIALKIPGAKSREELNAVLKVIDRILRINHYWIPNWYISGERVAYWDVFDRPAKTPKYGTGSGTWWWSEEKAKKLGISSD